MTTRKLAADPDDSEGDLLLPAVSGCISDDPPKAEYLLDHEPYFKDEAMNSSIDQIGCAIKRENHEPYFKDEAMNSSIDQIGCAIKRENHEPYFKDEAMNSSIDQIGCAIKRGKSRTFKRHRFKRGPVSSNDIAVEIAYCGLCAADISWIKESLNYPTIPGHEIVGIVEAVGSGVTNFKVGDVIGVLTYLHCCDSCEWCKKRLQVFCKYGPLHRQHGDGDTTDGDTGDTTDTKVMTLGGFSRYIVIDQMYCVIIPAGLPLKSIPPLLCDGVATVYNAILQYHIGDDTKMGVIGLGFHGSLALRFGKGKGFKVTVFTTNPASKLEALKLGADACLLLVDNSPINELGLDFIICTKATTVNLDRYLPALKPFGVLVMAAGLPKSIRFDPAMLVMGKTISGSKLGGGKREVQDMLRLCVDKKIYPDVIVKKVPLKNAKNVKDDATKAVVIDMRGS